MLIRINPYLFRISRGGHFKVSFAKNIFFPLHNSKIQYVKHILHQSLNKVTVSSSWCWGLLSNDPFGVSLQLCQATHKENLHASFLLGETVSLLLTSSQGECILTVSSTSKQMLMKQVAPLFGKGGCMTQKTERPSTCRRKRTSLQIGNHRLISCYHFFAISHGVTPLRWQKKRRTIQTSESKVTANSHWSIWGDHTHKLFWHASHAFDFSQHQQNTRATIQWSIYEREHGSNVTIVYWQSGTVRFIALSSYLVTISCKHVHGTYCPCRTMSQKKKKRWSKIAVTTHMSMTGLHGERLILDFASFSHSFYFVGLQMYMTNRCTHGLLQTSRSCYV